jgi:hypothetical protein
MKYLLHITRALRMFCIISWYFEIGLATVYVISQIVCRGRYIYLVSRPWSISVLVSLGSDLTRENIKILRSKRKKIG